MKRFYCFVLRLFALAVFGFAAFSTGCTSVQVSDDTQGRYRVGELQVFADHDFATVVTAVERGFKDLGLFQTKNERKVIEAELTARDASDTLIIVKLKEVSKNRVSVKIRYGLTGDLAQAQKLYQAIEKRF